MGEVQAARTRARQRLLGALVLLSVGVIGFPLLFESQPRPIPVDLPISIPAKEVAPPLTLPGSRAASGPVAARAEAVPEMITETQADAGREVKPASASASAVAAAAPKVSSVPVTRPTNEMLVANAKTAPSAPARAAPPQPASQVAAVRFIVQVGAFADAALAREARLKVERLGLQTYTQVADTPGGKRIRVRVGPYAQRADADQAMARVRAAGLPAALLTL